jgi:D-glycero-D-manno-heptose 1,7-bisphosphate phosphatase
VSAAERIVVLDRDGTIVVDRGYLSDPAGLEFESGATEGLRLLSLAGYRLVVATNQSGVGRGLFTLEQLDAMNARLMAMVESAGARLDAIYSCPHAPHDQCDCRKPAQGLLQRAASELGFDPASAIVIGDKDSDIEFGRRAGAKTVLIRPSCTSDPAPHPRPDLVVPSLFEAAKRLLALREERG